MRFAVFIFATIAALMIYGRWSNPPSPYAVTVPVDRRPGLRVEVYEPRPRVVYPEKGLS